MNTVHHKKKLTLWIYNFEQLFFSHFMLCCIVIQVQHKNLPKLRIIYYLVKDSTNSPHKNFKAAPQVVINFPNDAALERNQKETIV